MSLEGSRNLENFLEGHLEGILTSHLERHLGKRHPLEWSQRRHGDVSHEVLGHPPNNDGVSILRHL